MKIIEYKSKTVAIIHKQEKWKEGLDFITPNETFIQAGTWFYNEGKSLRSHRHKLYERKVLQTQEVVVVMEGYMRINFYDDANDIFQKEIVSKGDFCVILDVGHGYEILSENTKIIEVKNGPFLSVELDKELI